jgi:hypothetical protein
VSRDAALHLADSEASCRLILELTAGMAAPRFRADRKTVDAVVRNLEVIGEAIKHLPASIKERRPDVAWRKIAGFREYPDPRLFRRRSRHRLGRRGQQGPTVAGGGHGSAAGRAEVSATV